MSTEDRAIDIEALARQAASRADWTGHDAAPYETVTLNESGLQMFAAAVLEEAAKISELHVWWEADVNVPSELTGPENQHLLIAKAIRAEAAKLKEQT